MKSSWKFALAMAGLSTVPAEAQVRTWAFSRDAVNEWASGGDTVSLVNQAADTLKFDSAWLEPIGPAPQGIAVRFYRANTSTYYALNTGSTNWGPSPRILAVPPFQSIQLREFWVDIDSPPLTKRAAGSALGDTLRARVILLASADRGRDTLLVNGTQQTTSLRFLPASWSRTSDATASPMFDLLGRRVELSPGAVRVPVRPLLAPKDRTAKNSE